MQFKMKTEAHPADEAIAELVSEHAATVPDGESAVAEATAVGFSSATIWAALVAYGPVVLKALVAAFLAGQAAPPAPPKPVPAPTPATPTN